MDKNESATHGLFHFSSGNANKFQILWLMWFFVVAFCKMSLSTMGNDNVQH